MNENSDAHLLRRLKLGEAALKDVERHCDELIREERQEAYSARMSCIKAEQKAFRLSQRLAACLPHLRYRLTITIFAPARREVQELIDQIEADLR